MKPEPHPPTPTGPIALKPIGVVRSEFVSPVGTPIQPAFGREATGQIVIEPEYEAALDDIEGYDRLWVIFWMTGVRGWKPRVVPYHDTREHGLFATRSPARPNPIGISPVRLVRREGRVLHIAELDILDGTPVLDLKPYVPEFDAHPDARSGWFGEARGGRGTADERFHEEK